MEKYDVILYDMNSASEIKGTVYADEGDTSDDIILEISVGKNTITEKADTEDVLDINNDKSENKKIKTRNNWESRR